MPDTPKQFELSLAPYGGTLFISDIEGLIGWAQAEANTWEPILQGIQQKDRTQYARTVCDALRGMCNSILSEATKFKTLIAQGQLKTDSPVEDAIQSIQSLLKNNGELYVPASSLFGMFIAELSASDPLATAFALGTGMRLSWDRRGINPAAGETITNYVRGAHLAELFSQGLYKRKDLEIKALDKLRQEWVKKLAVQAGEYADAIEKTKVNLEDRRREEINHDIQFNRDVQTQHSAFNDAIKAAKDEFTNLQKVFNKQLSLQSSVQYWRVKANNSRWACAALLAVAAVVGVALLWNYQKTNAPSAVVISALTQSGTPITQVAGVAAIPPTQTSLPAIDWVHFSIALSTLLFGAWAIRVLLKIAMELWATGTDAAERATMIESYLALMKEASGLPPEAITILLQAIFRKNGANSDAPNLMDNEALKNLRDLLNR